MKTSFYNIYVKNKQKNTICFNTLLDSFCILSNTDMELLKTDLEKFAVCSPKVYHALVDMGFLVDDEKDEFADLCKEYNEAVNTENSYYLTLLPSLDCNLRCWYCFEKHIKNSHLLAEISEAIFNLVKRLFEENSRLSNLNIELFGGEPLLYFEEELYPLLVRIKEYVHSIGKSISFFFVTNAVCITEKNIPMFNELGASFQISIDGFKDRHDKVKFIPETNEGTYDRMIQTIHILTAQLDNVYINLRINYDDETLPHMPKLIEELADINRNKIGIHLERVWQTGGISNYENEELKHLINLWMMNGFKVSYMNMERRSYSCKASVKNQSVVSYNGAVYKCSGRDFTSEHQEGTLQADGNIVWNEEKLGKRLKIQTYNNSQCRNCKFLPLCWGPCCQKQLESPEKDFTRYCQKQNMELSIADYVRYRFNNAYIIPNNHKNKIQ